MDSWTQSNHPSKKLEQTTINTNSKLNSETAVNQKSPLSLPYDLLDSFAMMPIECEADD